MIAFIAQFIDLIKLDVIDLKYAIRERPDGVGMTPLLVRRKIW